MMLPRILESSQQERETSSAVREANSKFRRQLIDRPAENHRDNAKLCLCRHADSPRHHVLRHSLRRQHVPGMNQHGRAFLRAVMQEGHDPWIIEIFVSHVIADLHAKMASTHASAQFLARSVNILQRNLAKRLQPLLPLRAKFQGRIIEKLCTIQRVLYRALEGEHTGGGRETALLTPAR